MEKIVLKATKRTVIGKQVKALRREGKLPGVIYGRHSEPIAIQLDAHESELTIPKLTSSSVVTIDLEGKQIPALVREKQMNYIKRALNHVDFQAVSLTEKITAWVSIHLTGVSPAVKDYNAVIVTNASEVEVEALPQDLPQRFDVDITRLARVGDAIHVSDLALPKGVTLLSDPEEVIVIATGVVQEAEEVETGAAEPELVEKKKKEDAEG